MNAVVLDQEISGLSETADALMQAFDATFDFWLLQNDGTNRILPDDRRAMSQSAARAESCPGEPAARAGLNPELAAKLQEAVHPILLEQTDGSIVIGVPLRESSGGKLVATARLRDTRSDLAIKLARMSLCDLRLQEQLRSHQQDLDICAAQIGADFEELAFLRSLADHLDLAEVSQGTWQVAQMVLPLLATVIQAESLVLVVAEDFAAKGASCETDRPIVWVGPRRLDDDACRRFVEKYRQEAKGRPLVKNHLAVLPEGKEFPEVRKFIMVSLSKGDRDLGWLVAINHARQDATEGDNSLWALSQFEFGTVEAGLLTSVASMLATHARNVELFREKEAFLINVVRAMVSAIDAKDPYTCGHSERVAILARHLGKTLGLDNAQCERLYLAGLLHDLGKLGVPDAVLRKPGRLSDEELAQIRPHPEQGWAILQDLDQLGHLIPGVLHHHERYDGAGYPDGLAGNDIPLSARILAVTDSYDAMISDRPYRKGMPHEVVEKILREGSGTQWDPAVINAFFQSLAEIKTLWHAYQSQAPRCRQREKTPGAAISPPT